MFSHMSPKRSTAEIGRFGLGFKSVLGVTDAPEFYSRAGSFRFDKEEARRQIEKIVPHANRYPALRLAFPADHSRAVKRDRTLRKLSQWASNIVSLPLNESGYANLKEQISSFPVEFLLFVTHVERLILRAPEAQINRTIEAERKGLDCCLVDSGARRRWMLFSRMHTLSDDARGDRRTLDDNDEVPIHWAAPLDRLDRPGHFWAFFPTMTSSLVAGILNAPWKTNEDRQNLLPGPYNEELIEAAATLVADSLPKLATEDDPARHLDALPRRQESDDSEQVNLLRQRLFDDLRERNIVPDEDGLLRRVEALRYPPREFIQGRKTIAAPLERWAALPDRPRDWLHHRAVTANRLAALDRLHPAERVPGAQLSEWLEALVGDSSGQDPITASVAAIQTAAAIPPDIRKNKAPLGDIVLTASGGWQMLDSRSVFLPDTDEADDPAAASLVHPALVADEETLAALQTLGIEWASPQSRFRLVADRLMESEPEEGVLEEFWAAARGIEPEAAHGIIARINSPWWRKLRVRSLSGSWRTLFAA